MSFSDSEPRVSPLRQLGTYLAVILSSIALTLLTLRIFPGLLPVLPPAPGQVQEIAAQTAVQASPSSFVAVAIQRVGPAVVRIDTERTISANPVPFFNDPFFRDFFGYDPFPSQPREFRQRGEGSGFIIDPNGVIVTNAHVVSGADTVTVTLKDGRKFKGKVRGIDEPSDLAIVKIDGKNLPVAPLGNSSDVQVGDWAIAVGNPLGLDNTVTLGIVSTLNRSSAQVGIPDKRLDFIQTDAAINPGNSGGPLVSDRGEVIGINTAIRPDAQGIGFAIPIDTAKAIKDTLIKGERVQHPYLGIRMLTLTPDLAEQLKADPNAPANLPETEGVLIVQVIPNSPAAAAGLRQGDVITRIGGRTVKTAEQLQDVVEKSKINQPLNITVQRGNQTQDLTVRPGELQDAVTR
ncbi:MAG: trypsin-like peptidase domain-containing protein [Leptolyngbyaceae cyanobacterium HOT.MB2.61]|nr:trypsin-like peptidase domain-containing protein [Leptolyngbyaceae cyanobacterium HOT.MB2.61]